MFKRLVSALAGGLGYEIRRKSTLGPGRRRYALGYDMEAEAEEQVGVVQNYTMLTYPRLVTLYQQAVYCERSGMEGSFVECGTWRGGAVGIMALANMRHGRARRHLHLFDSFEGIPEPDAAVDGELAVREAKAAGGAADGKLSPLPLSIGPLEANRELLEERIGYDPEFLHYHKGWFQETLPQAAGVVGPIAILRLDGDWYASTKVCLEHLYTNVVSGGFVIIDDYGTYEGCRKAVDEFLASEQVKPFLHHIDSTGRYLIKP
jgi:hypothetical protein